MKAKGLPRLTVIERYMRGDEEIKNLYNFSQHLYPYLHHIDSEKFKFTSEKFITPDRICFDFDTCDSPEKFAEFIINNNEAYNAFKWEYYQYTQKF